MSKFDPRLREKILVSPMTVSMRMELHSYVGQLEADKQLAETQFIELLSALYQKTDDNGKSFTLYRRDIVELANDYGIKEEELNVFRAV